MKVIWTLDGARLTMQAEGLVKRDIRVGSINVW